MRSRASFSRVSSTVITKRTFSFLLACLLSCLKPGENLQHKKLKYRLDVRRLLARSVARLLYCLCSCFKPKERLCASPVLLQFACLLALFLSFLLGCLFACCLAFLVACLFACNVFLSFLGCNIAGAPALLVQGCSGHCKASFHAFPGTCSGFKDWKFLASASAHLGQGCSEHIPV